MNSRIDKNLRYSQISSLQELLDMQKCVRMEIIQQQRAIREDFSGIIRPVTNIKAAISSGFMFLFGGGLVRSVKEGFGIGQKAVKLIRSQDKRCV